MCQCDFDPPSFYSVTVQKARRPHTCCECRRAILAGETYRRHFGIWDGDAGAFKVCLVCGLLAASYEWLTDCCTPFGELFSELHELFRYER